MVDNYTIHCIENEQLWKLMRYIECPVYRAAVLCCNHTVMMAMVHDIKSLMPTTAVGRVYYDAKHKVFRFESGATIRLDNIEHRDSVFKHAGANYHYVAFIGCRVRDFDHEYMKSRLRNTRGYDLPLELTITR